MSILTVDRIVKTLAATSLASLIYLSMVGLHDEYVAIPHMGKVYIKTITDMKQNFVNNVEGLATDAINSNIQLVALKDQAAKKDKEIASLKADLKDQHKKLSELMYLDITHSQQDYLRINELSNDLAAIQAAGDQMVKEVQENYMRKDDCVVPDTTAPEDRKNKEF